MLLEPFRADTPLLSQRLLLLRLSGLRCLPGRGDRVQALPRQRLLVLQRRWGKGRNRWTCNTHLVIHFDFFEFKFKFDVCAPCVQHLSIRPRWEINISQVGLCREANPRVTTSKGTGPGDTGEGILILVVHKT